MKESLAVWAVLFVCAQAQIPLRGRLDQLVASQVVAAPRVKVVVRADNGVLDSTTTDQAGMYYLRVAQPGNYRLVVTPRESDTGLTEFEYRFRVRLGVTRADLPAQLLNRFDFLREARDPAAPETVRVRGTHSFPNGTVIWLMFGDANGGYDFRGDHVVLKTREEWSARMAAPTGPATLFAVLATMQARQEFTDRLEGSRFGAIDRLPTGARTVATCALP